MCFRSRLFTRYLPSALVLLVAFFPARRLCAADHAEEPEKHEEPMSAVVAEKVVKSGEEDDMEKVLLAKERFLSSQDHDNARSTITIPSRVGVLAGNSEQNVHPRTIYIEGTDWLSELLALWALEFQADHPEVGFVIRKKDSADAVPALLRRKAHLGPCGFSLSWQQVSQFERIRSYKPTIIKVCSGSVLVVVSKYSPVTRITFQQLDAIFSATHYRGGKEITTLEQMGIQNEGKLANHIYVHTSAEFGSASQFFAKTVMLRGRYRSTREDHQNYEELLYSVKKKGGAFGIVQGDYREISKDLRVLEVSLTGRDGSFYLPDTQDTDEDFRYPLTAPCYLVIDRPPSKSVDIIIEKFLRFILSQEAQNKVTELGFYPLSTDDMRRGLRVLTNDPLP